jgi:hypothetical protein
MLAISGLVAAHALSRDGLYGMRSKENNTSESVKLPMRHLDACI